jgi:hypothetical protein
MTAPGKQLSDANTGGTGLGQSTADTISFYGVTPIAQRSGSTQSALTVTATTASGVFGFTTTTLFSAAMAQLEEIRATLVALGLMHGS